MTTRTTTAPRRCIGSSRFGIEAHEAPVGEFAAQPSRKDGLAVMCKPHWDAYVKGLAADRKKAVADGTAPPKPGRGTKGALAKMAEPAAKPARAKREPEPRPESPRVRKARATLAATQTLGGAAYTEAVGSTEVQAALETLHGHGTSEPDDGAILVAGVLYHTETLEEVSTEEDDAA